jgi:uncharacterized membrane protein
VSSPTREPDAPVFAARITPHRSLSRGQARVLLACVGGVSMMTSLPFVIMGAWPVAGFFGVDVLLVYLAFAASFRAARAYEIIRVTMIDLFVEKVSPRGRRAEWHFNPRWVRLERKEHEEFGVQRLDLVSRGSTLEIAGFLGPDAKAALADRLTRALNEVRRGILAP